MLAAWHRTRWAPADGGVKPLGFQTETLPNNYITWPEWLSYVAKNPEPHYRRAVDEVRARAAAILSRLALTKTDAGAAPVTVTDAAEGISTDADGLREAATAGPSPAEPWETIDTAPSKGEPVWVWGGIVKQPQRRQADGEWWRLQRKQGSKTVITHWMHDRVPAPPRPGQEGDAHGE